MSLTLGLDPTPEEPAPFIVRVWYHGISRDEPFVTREDAIEEAAMLMETDCSVEGVFGPDGNLDLEADRIIRPWNYL